MLAFDIEPDDRVGIPAPGSKVDWSGVPATFDFVDGWRDRLAEATGHPAAFSWYVRMDPAITSLHGDPCWPWPLWAPISGDRFWDLIENDPLRLERPCVVFASRSDTAIREGGVDSFGDKLEALTRRPLARSVRFVAPHEALRMLSLID